MANLINRTRARNGGPDLPLFEYAERQRWAGVSRAARMVRRRCAIESPSLAAAMAELAGFNSGDDR
jgi:hypothetical protein